MRTFAVAAFLALLFLMPMSSASTISRSFSRNPVSLGETVSVTLDVALTAGESYYLIDEIVPSGWVVTNAGPAGSSEDPGHVKWAVIQNAASTSYVYQVMAPQTAGAYAFSGKYMLEGMNAEGAIGGQSSITVQAAATGASGPGYGSLVAPAIIVAGLLISVAAFILKSKKLRR